MTCRRLVGRSTLITGAASGVGRATVHRFAEEGAALVCLFDRDESNLAVVADEVTERGAVARTFLGDVASDDDCQAAVDLTVAETGGLDILVSNAPAHSASDFVEMTTSEWDRVITVNLRASFVIGQRAGRHDRRQPQRRHSLYGVGVRTRRFDAVCAYGASKAGIVNLTKTMAIELVQHGIRVNSVSPGPLDTPQSLAVLGSEEAMTRARVLAPRPDEPLGAAGGGRRLLRLPGLGRR